MRCGNKAWLCDLELDWSDAAEEGMKEKFKKKKKKKKREAEVA